MSARDIYKDRRNDVVFKWYSSEQWIFPSAWSLVRGRRSQVTVIKRAAFRITEAKGAHGVWSEITRRSEEEGSNFRTICSAKLRSCTFRVHSKREKR